MASADSWITRISDLMVPIHRDGHKFIAVTLAVAFLGFLIWTPLGWIFAILTAAVALFFRDPERIAPVRQCLIIAPSDGRVSAIAAVVPPAELGLDDKLRTRVSIDLSLFDVHINRAPVGGRIVRSVYVPGAFKTAVDDKASEENERRSLVIETPDGHQVAVVQIAGGITRRIVTFAGEGDTLSVGQRFGLIRFGSRLDLYLPPGTSALIAVGQRMIAGETVISDVSSNEPPREARPV